MAHRSVSTGNWQPDLFGGVGIQRADGINRADNLDRARQEMRDTGSRDLFDAIADEPAQCEHDWFEGIATQWCLKCGATQATARFERKWQERRIVKA